MDTPGITQCCLPPGYNNNNNNNNANIYTGRLLTFLHQESVLQHNKRNCFPSQPDHYLTIILEVIFIIIMVMVVEEGEGRGGGRGGSWYFVHINFMNLK